MKFKTAVVIGRFQPFHLGHQELIESALALAERVVVVVGSACAARSLRNPFTADERIEMMKLNLPEPDRVRYVRVRDYFYNDSGWINEVREKVREEAGSGTTAIVGHDKDSTSGYLKWFPEWERVELAGKKTGATNVTTTCHGTEIRESYLRDEKSTSIRTELSIATKSWLMEFASR
ncbi:MAG: adenylyltransferase/cytidyltransferase family protein, partial [Bdellovibrionota bacterium]